MYKYDLGDLIMLKIDIAYLAKKYTYLENDTKLFDNYVDISKKDLFIVISKDNEFSPNSVKILSARTGDLLEAYPHIFARVEECY